MSVSVLTHLNIRHPFKWLEESVLPGGCLSEGSEGRHPSGRWRDPRSWCVTGKLLAMKMAEDMLL